MIQLVRDQCDLRKQKNGKYPLLGWDKLKYFTKKKRNTLVDEGKNTLKIEQSHPRKRKKVMKVNQWAIHKQFANKVYSSSSKSTF